MNERIQELAEQAYEQQPLMVVNSQTYEPEHKIGNGGVPMYHRVFNQEKFAELIVKECWTTISPFIEDDNLAEDALAELKEHFGVEE